MFLLTVIICLILSLVTCSRSVKQIVRHKTSVHEQNVEGH